VLDVAVEMDVAGGLVAWRLEAAAGRRSVNFPTEMALLRPTARSSTHVA
jgi:hypothetical protein